MDYIFTYTTCTHTQNPFKIFCFQRLARQHLPVGYFAFTPEIYKFELC